MTDIDLNKATETVVIGEVSDDELFEVVRRCVRSAIGTEFWNEEWDDSLRKVFSGKGVGIDADDGFILDDLRPGDIGYAMPFGMYWVRPQ